MAKQVSRREIRYVYRVDIERGTWPRIYWRKGYSEDLPGGEVRYPLLTKAEAQADAKSRGGRAVFVDGQMGALRAKKPLSQIKREIAEVLSRRPGNKQPPTL